MTFATGAADLHGPLFAIKMLDLSESLLLDAAMAVNGAWPTGPSHHAAMLYMTAVVRTSMPIRAALRRRINSSRALASHMVYLGSCTHLASGPALRCRCRCIRIRQTSCRRVRVPASFLPDRVEPIPGIFSDAFFGMCTSAPLRFWVCAFVDDTRAPPHAPHAPLEVSLQILSPDAPSAAIASV